jgi:hypothetical protein
VTEKAQIGHAAHLPRRAVVVRACRGRTGAPARAQRLVVLVRAACRAIHCSRTHCARRVPNNVKEGRFANWLAQARDWCVRVCACDVLTRAQVNLAQSVLGHADSALAL